jgi:hypothetical protein
MRITDKYLGIINFKAQPVKLRPCGAQLYGLW